MAQGRARARSSAGQSRGRAGASAGQSRGRNGGAARGGIPWLGLGLLLVIGAGVVAARTMGFSAGEQVRSAQPTVTSVNNHAVTSTAAPIRATEVAAAQSKRTPTVVAAPTVVRAEATQAPVAAPVAPPRSTVARAATAPTAVSAAEPAAHATAPRANPPEPAAQAPAAALSATATAPPVEVSVRATQAPAPPQAASAAGSVTLTFDAGADRGYAEDILDQLQSDHVVASFGITGQWARANPDVVRRIAADGHMVINHTLDHRSFTGVSDQRGGLSATRRRAELEDADAIIAPLLGHSSQPWYRLPYGDDDGQVSADVRPAGYTHKVGWSVDSLGWRGIPASDIVVRCLSLAAPGAVYVLHVGHASQDALALPQIIQGLREKGFSFHRVDQG